MTAHDRLLHDLMATRVTELARAIGPGFHPDTRGRDYTTLPEGITPLRVDTTLAAAVDAGVDVYAVAVMALPAEVRHARARVAVAAAVADLPEDPCLG